MIKKIQKIAIFVFLFLASFAFSQQVGDYRSAVTTGNWNAVASWQTWNGTTWVTPTTYPGQTTSNIGTITIRSGNTININADYNVNVNNVFVDGGILDFTANATLTLANSTNTTIFRLINGGTLSPISGGACNANKIIVINTVKLVSCSGGGSPAPLADFTTFNTNGRSYNTPIYTGSAACPNKTGTLSNSATIPASVTQTYSWVQTSGPSGGSVIASSSSASTTVTMNLPGTYVFTLTATNTSSTLSPYNTSSQTVTVVSLLDSDGDCVPDSTDLDDDNDGVLDANECGSLFANEFYGTFGTNNSYLVRDLQTSPSNINYTYRSRQSTDPVANVLLDGNYSVMNGYVNNLHVYWNGMVGHTTGLASDMFLAVNGSIGTANFFVSTFYLSANTPYNFGFWAANANNSATNASTYPVNLGYRLIRVSDGATVASGSTGNITTSHVWTLSSGTYTTGSTTELYRFEVYNLSTGAAGNDFALDDIYFTGCGDYDGDGVPNYLDLDSDNDGCPDATEGANHYTTTATLTGGSNGGSSGNLGTASNSNGIPLPLGTTGGIETTGQATTASVTTATEILVTTAPTNQAVNTGNSATFTIATSATNTTVFTGTAPNFLPNYSAGTPATGTVYQWQVSTNGGTTYTNLANGGVYSGVNTASLYISNVNGLNGNVYNVIVTHPNNACTNLQRNATLTTGDPCTVGATFGTPTLNDPDADGINNLCDLDDDNDGILDVNECDTSTFFWSSAPVVSGSTATGTINGINYIYTSSSPVTTTNGVFGYGNFPASYGVPNLNPTIQNTFATNNTLRFETPITNPVLVFASVGDPGIDVPINFAAPVELLFGVGTTQTSPTTIVGREGYAIVRMLGTYSTISFNYLTVEYYCNFVFGASFISNCDTDGDGIPDNLDLDSDNDGCSDAIEGDENVLNSQLVTAPVGSFGLQGGNGTNPTTTPTSGTFNQAIRLNLGTTVSSTGVPTIVNTGGAADIGSDSGQGVGSSANAAINSCICYNDPNIASTGIATKHGITLLNRAGADNGNWPMLRNSAHTVLESNTKGFVITRLPTADFVNITNPVDGMMVYDTTAKCLKIYTVDDVTPANSAWSCFSTPTCP